MKLLRNPSLYRTSAIYQLLGVVVLWPVFGWLVRWWLSWSGEPAVTDQAIAGFLMSPMGALGGLIALSLGVCILALEQTGLITQIMATNHGYRVSTVNLIRYSFRRFGQTVALVLIIVLRGLIWFSPLLILAVAIAWWFLREHDINFYLTERPPEFYWAAAIVGAIGLIGVVTLLPLVLSWSLALPVMLIQSVSPRQSLMTSRELLRGKTFRVVLAWLVWVVLQGVLAWLFAAFVFQIARFAVGYAGASLPVLVPILGLFAAIWFAGNFLLALLRSVSFAVLAVSVFERFAQNVGGSERITAAVGRRIDESYFHRLGGRRINSSHDANDSETASGKPVGVEFSGRRILLTAGCLGVVAIAIGLWLLRSVKAVDDVVVIAHRGASAYAPDNSLAAFEQAIAARADYIELDVQESADGTVVVFHDSDFMKSSGIAAKVWETTFDQMQQFDIGSRFDTRFSGQRVPTLTEALRLCKDRIQVIIELKYYGHNQKLVERVAEIVARESMVDQIVLMSLKPELVREAKRHRPTWTVGLLAAVAVGDLTKTDNDFLAVNAKLATRSFMQRARRRGVKVYIWTVDDPTAMVHYLSLGIDGIITNKPDLARQVIDHYQSLSLVDRFLLDAAIRIGVVPFQVPTVAEVELIHLPNEKTSELSFGGWLQGHGISSLTINGHGN